MEYLFGERRGVKSNAGVKYARKHFGDLKLSEGEDTFDIIEAIARAKTDPSSSVSQAIDLMERMVSHGINSPNIDEFKENFTKESRVLEYTEPVSFNDLQKTLREMSKSITDVHMKKLITLEIEAIDKAKSLIASNDYKKDSFFQVEEVPDEDYDEDDLDYEDEHFAQPKGDTLPIELVEKMEIYRSLVHYSDDELQLMINNGILPEWYDVLDPIDKSRNSHRTKTVKPDFKRRQVFNN